MKTEINAISLCDGESCGRLVLEKLNFNVTNYLRSEIKPYADTVANKNFPMSEPLGDMTKITEEDIMGLDFKVHALISGTPCFVAGSKVHTSNGYKSIEDIKEGDKVLTHTNKFQTVNGLISHPVNKVTKVKLYGTQEIICTDNHPFYCITKTPKCVNYTRGYEYSDPKWVNARDLIRNEHLVGVNINQVQREIDPVDGVPLDNDTFYWFMGRYLADGWCSEYKDHKSKNAMARKVVLCCSHEEGNFVESQLDKLNLHYSKAIERTVNKYYFANYRLMNFMKMFGKYAHGKLIPQSIQDLPKDKLKHFIEGYRSGDGSFDSARQQTNITTVSEDLARGFQNIIHKVYEMPCRIDYCKRPNTCVIGGRTVNQRDTYQIRYKLHQTRESIFIKDNKMWFPVRTVKIDEPFETEVFNIDVEEDHSYTINNAIVKNCQSHSRNGKHGGFDDPRGELFFDFINILNWIREHNNPDVIFFFENVQMKKESVKFISDSLETDVIKLDSKYFSNQRRLRYYWTNLKVDDVDKSREYDYENTVISKLDSNVVHEWLTYEQVNDMMKSKPIEYIKGKTEYGNDNIVKSEVFLECINSEMRVRNATKLGYLVASNGDTISVSFPNSKTRRGRVGIQKFATLDTSCAQMIYFNGKFRHPTIIELERAQGLPDNYTKGVSSTDRKDLIGEGWQIDTVMFLLKNLEKAVIKMGNNNN